MNNLWNTRKSMEKEIVEDLDYRFASARLVFVFASQQRATFASRDFPCLGLRAQGRAVQGGARFRASAEGREQRREPEALA